MNVKALHQREGRRDPGHFSPPFFSLISYLKPKSLEGEKPRS